MTELEALKIATHRHYNGGLYRFIGYALHTETEEIVVVYDHIWPHTRAMFVRPSEMFFGKLEDGTVRFVALEANENLVHD